MVVHSAGFTAKCMAHTLISLKVSCKCLFIKHPLRDACLCMGDLQVPLAPPAPHFVFLITLINTYTGCLSTMQLLGKFFSNLAGLGSSLGKLF